MLGSLKGKTFVVMGIANKRSIGWGIARSLDRAGARLVITYNQDRMERNVRQLAETLESGEEPIILQCNVADDESIRNCFAAIKEKVGVIHGLAHCIAYADREDLQGEFVDTSRDGFLLAQNISAYSLTAVAREAKELMTEGGSIVTLTYLGGERVVQNYNVMGVAKASLEASVKYLANDLGKYNIRVNAISAGPIRTLSAKGVRDFNTVLNVIEERARSEERLQRKKSGIPHTLFSDLSRGITGENIHVDSGYHILGM